MMVKIRYVDRHGGEHFLYVKQEKFIETMLNLIKGGNRIVQRM